jgi:hypothetical protein
MLSKPSTCCECGSYEHTVPMPIDGKVCDIDFCVADIVAALEAGNLHPVASCCGHGKQAGSVVLRDGRELQIESIAKNEVLKALVHKLRKELANTALRYIPDENIDCWCGNDCHPQHCDKCKRIRILLDETKGFDPSADHVVDPDKMVKECIV